MSLPPVSMALAEASGECLSAPCAVLSPLAPSPTNACSEPSDGPCSLETVFLARAEDVLKLALHLGSFLQPQAR